VRHRAGRGLEHARRLLEGAVSITGSPLVERPLVLERITNG
jgi:hypothetical protein